MCRASDRESVWVSVAFSVSLSSISVYRNNFESSGDPYRERREIPQREAYGS